MARNYQIGEAVEIIAAGEDAVAIQDLGRRYPLLVAKVAKAVSGPNADAVVEMFGYMPEYLSANKVNKTIKAALGIDGSERPDDDEADEKPAKAPAKKAPAKKAPAKKAKSDDPYAGMDAIALFKECKKRGIKAAPKKTAKYYADLLKKADAEADEAEADDWDEDDEAEEAPKKPAKKAAPKKAAKQAEPEEDDDEDEDDDWDI